MTEKPRKHKKDRDYRRHAKMQILPAENMRRIFMREKRKGGASDETGICR